MEYKDLVNQLKESYRSIFAEQSAAGLLSWAQTKISNPAEIVSPTIPFIGKGYFAQGKKILLYASAENLAGYNGHLDDDGLAINRHRWYKDHVERDFYPWVHIAPVTDGSLLIVLRYICEQLGIDMPVTPKEFVEAISFANFGKFSIKLVKGSERNIDYAQSKSKLDCCMPYIEKDLEVLKPDIIVMFQTMYSAERSEIERLKGEAKLILLTQINARTVNTNLKRRYALKDETELSPVIRDWYDSRHFNKNKFTNRTHTNFLSVFTYLDEVLKAQK